MVCELSAHTLDTHVIKAVGVKDTSCHLVGGKPQFGTDCIGCLSCVQLCPKSAIDIGLLTKKRERFPSSRIKPMELTEKVIHID